MWGGVHDVGLLMMSVLVFDTQDQCVQHGASCLGQNSSHMYKVPRAGEDPTLHPVGLSILDRERR